MSTPPDDWDNTEHMVRINRIIGPIGRIVLRAVGAKQKRQFGDYYIYDYRNDADWGDDDWNHNLREYYAELLAHPPRTVMDIAREKGWPLITMDEALAMIDEMKAKKEGSDD